MTDQKDSEVLALLQPDLLTKEDLIGKIETRCCRVENLSQMSKERLVGLFRQVVSPLPQRLYRTNRRGKMLSSRRAKAGLEGGRKREKEDAGDSDRNHPTKVSHTHDRLKPPPDVSHFRSNSNSKFCQSFESSNRIVNDRKSQDFESHRSDSFRKYTLKRPSGFDRYQSGSSSSTDNKKQRTAIKWP